MTANPSGLVPKKESDHMPNLFELKETRAAKVDELRKIDFAAGDENRKRFDALDGEVRTLDADILRAEKLAEAERRAAATLVRPGQDSAEGRAADVSLQACFQSVLAGKPLTGLEAEWNQEHSRRSGSKGNFAYPPGNLVNIESRTARVGNDPSGGYMVGTVQRNDLMGELLKPTPIVSTLGATPINGLTGDVEIPIVDGEPAAQWVGEHSAPTASDATFGKVRAAPKTVAGLTEVSRRLILQTSASIEALLRRMLGDQLALAMDRAAINGDGILAPLGLLNMPSIPTLALGTNGLAPTADHMADMIGMTDSANVTAPRQFLTTQKVRKVAMKAKDGQNRPFGVPAFFQDQPATFSNQVPSNLTKGSGTDLSAVVYGDFSELYLLFWSAVDILVNPYADSVASKGGVLVHSFLDMNVIVRRPAAFAVIKDAVA
jgi:HK97 family phage major capsid protein